MKMMFIVRSERINKTTGDKEFLLQSKENPKMYNWIPAERYETIKSNPDITLEINYIENKEIKNIDNTKSLLNNFTEKNKNNYIVPGVKMTFRQKVEKIKKEITARNILEYSEQLELYKTPINDPDYIYVKVFGIDFNRNPVAIALIELIECIMSFVKINENSYSFICK